MKKYLLECKAAYYAGSPIISDSQYDALEELCSEDLTVGTNKGRSRHLHRMYSLDKVYEGEENVLDDVSFCIQFFVSPKLDGAAVSIIYLNGMVQSINTRGDGIYGENVADIITHSKGLEMGIPTYIKHKGLMQVTGEVVAPKEISNARNYAAGALNLKDSLDFQEKDVTFFAYDIQENDNELYTDTLGQLVELGFKTVANKLSRDYPQDGYVYRLNSNKKYKDEGHTSKHPRGAFALKQRSEGVKTILLRVDWETGKSGKVTPVAILDQVDIDGAKVSRATLNNPGFIKSLDLHIGDAVMVERAGGIIPRIIKKAE
jgi:DNA ligase (NAD+)